MSLTKDALNRGVVVIKENYNLKNYPKTVLLTWYAILKDKLSDVEYERCIAILIDTVPNWYQAGESLASRVLAVLPQVRDRLRSERERLEQTAPAKALPMGEEERQRNVSRLSAILQFHREKLVVPRLEGETKEDRLARIDRETEAFVAKMDKENKC